MCKLESHCIQETPYIVICHCQAYLAVIITTMSCFVAAAGGLGGAAVVTMSGPHHSLVAVGVLLKKDM